MTDAGQVLDRVAFRVERGKVAEFARATMVRDAVHTDESVASAGGFDDVPATPTYLVVAGHYRSQQAMIGALGLDLARVVVGSVTWTYRQPLVAGASLTGTRRVISDVRRTNSRGAPLRLVTLETEYVADDGRPVAEVREVVIERGADR